MIKVFFEINDKERFNYLDTVYKIKTGESKTQQWGNSVCYTTEVNDIFDLADIIDECFKDGQQAVMYSIDAQVFFAYNHLKNLGIDKGHTKHQGLLFCTSDKDFIDNRNDDYSVFDGIYYFIHKEVK